MKEAKYVSTRDFPNPCLLDTAWLERLEISETDQRRYNNLTESERMKVESDRRVLHEYEQNGLLQSGKSVSGLMRHTAKAIDRHWLKGGKGRGVAFRSAFTILEAFARYRAWADTFAHYGEEVFLDVLIPYLISGSSTSFVPGFLGIQLSGTYPSVRKFGEVRWQHVSLNVHDIRAERKVKSDSFVRRPFDFYPFSISDREARKGNKGQDNKNGLVYLMSRVFSEVVEKKVRSLTHRDILSHALTVHFKHPSPAEIQPLLDEVARTYRLSGRVRARQLEFKVENDLSTRVSGVLLQREQNM